MLTSSDTNRVMRGLYWRGGGLVGISSNPGIGSHR